MKDISHKQAMKFIHRRLDEILDEYQTSLLKEHLQNCDSCRAYFDETESLSSQLQREFHSRWDRNAQPSEKIAANMHTQARKLIMSKRINIAFNLLGGVVVLFAMMVVLNSVISQFQKPDASSNETLTNVPASSSAQEPLIAFASDKDGNLDIYTMHPDGSGLTNLTNNPALDHNPYWSPDGKRIAFLSNRNDPGGLPQVYMMNADGTEVTQLTSNEVNHEFNVGDGGPWSPDGTKLLFTEWEPGNEKWKLYTVEIDGKNKTQLTDAPGNYGYASWSPDGGHIAFIKSKQQEGPQNREVLRIYVVNSRGQNLMESTKLVPPDEDLFRWEYSWSDNGQSMFFIMYRYYYENGNGRSALYQASLDGNLLSEIDHVSTFMGDWWNGTSLITNMGTNVPLTWLRPDGTHSTLNVYQYCEVFSTDHGFVFKRSPGGNLLIGAGCYNDDWWFHWANPDGTIIQQLLHDPIHVKEGSVGIFWSSDDRYAALSTASAGINSLYIVDVLDALKDPSYQPVHIETGKYGYSVSWQPLP